MRADEHDRDPTSQAELDWAAEMWHNYLIGGVAGLPPRMRIMMKLFKHLPRDPRCMICHTPFEGIGGLLARAAGRGTGKSGRLNPRLCALCEYFVKHYEVGTEVELTVMFADVRGSTPLAERLGPVEFHKLIDRFYRATTDVLIEHNALIEKMMGDEVTGLFVPGIAGQGYARRAVEAGKALLRATGHDDPDGPWIPVGVGVHTGRAYVGAVGSSSSVSDITVLGDTANAGARITSLAGPGEVYVSSATAAAAGLNARPLDTHEFELKGREEPMTVHVLRVGAPAVA